MTTVIKKKRVCIVVLGDIFRSPRMQYHCNSFLEKNYHVDLIGYVETKPPSSITEKIVIKKLNVFPELNLPNTVKYLFKTIWQMLGLFIALLSINRPDILLCQNPPAIPTLFVSYFYCLVMRCKFVIDWHNYAHTIMALNMSPKSLIVKIAKSIEIFFGRRSNANLCVTKAMKMDLERNYGICATVLYDRPPEQFQQITLKKKHELYRKLGEDYIEFHQEDSYLDENLIIKEKTIFTERLNDDVKLMPNRPGLLVSSTSWTVDEDFGILLAALEDYEKVSQQSHHYPKLICVITGKGPLKSHYTELIFRKNWKNVQIITPWLEIEDYPLLLASADLGVCLHYSSSGLDLPMKVVDMFGCGLPVCAINFKCLSELVENEKNGFTFDNSRELSSHIQNWFYDFPNNVALCNVKEKIQENLKQFQKIRWHENWILNAFPLFE